MNVAVLGLGFMGATHVKAWGSVRGAKVIALMSSNPRKLAGDLSSISGNLGTRGETFDFRGMRLYSSVADALRDSDVDTVDICLPSNLHAEVAVQALRAGKNVFVEKPLALSPADAARVVAAAEEAGRKLMCGHVLRFIGPYVELREKLRHSGRVLSAAFRRNCAVPAWMDVAASGGAVFDLLIHDLDYCVSLWGMPASVGPDYLHYPEIGNVKIEGGWHDDPEYPFSMEFIVVTEAGTYAWRSGDDDPIEDPFADELSAFTRYVNAGGEHPCPPRESVQAVILAEQMTEARRCRRSV